MHSYKMNFSARLEGRINNVNSEQLKCLISNFSRGKIYRIIGKNLDRTIKIICLRLVGFI